MAEDSRGKNLNSTYAFAETTQKSTIIDYKPAAAVKVSVTTANSSPMDIHRC